MVGTAVMSATGPLFALAWGSATDDVNDSGNVQNAGAGAAARLLAERLLVGSGSAGKGGPGGAMGDDGGGAMGNMSGGILMLLVGTAGAVGQFLKYATFAIFSENICHNIKLEYFRACLKKDATFYDEHNPNEMASKISQETLLISKGTGEKVSHVYGGMISLLIGYVVAVFICWRYTLILFAFVPFLAINTIIMSLAFKGAAMEGMKHYA